MLFRSARSAFARAARDFVDAQWAHMEYERSHLFPAAQAALADSDWEMVSRALARTEDPLFGSKPAGRLRALHRMLLACDSKDQAPEVLSR